MSDLILDSLEIQGFRAFHHLEIEKLGRVNLIVGKNNVGKTCLLEALRLYVRRGSPQVMWNILEERDESRRIIPFISSKHAQELANQISNARNLFYGRPNVWEVEKPIIIGPIDSPKEKLLIAARRTRQPINLQASDEGLIGSVPSLVVGWQDKRVQFPLWSNSELYDEIDIFIEDEPIRSTFVPCNGLYKVEIGELWDKAVLAQEDENVLGALDTIVSGDKVERLHFVGDENSRGRTPVVKLAGHDEFISLRSLGEGMNRLLGLALSLVNAKDGMLLVDEVESGLHYSVQPDVWRLVFETAKRLNVQVFATTHSYDCVRAFEKVALQHPEEGVIIRLYCDKNGDVKQTLFNEDDLEVVASQNIEVR